MRIIALVALLVLPRPAHAWGKLGHRAIAIMAEKRLTPQARETLRAILGPKAALADLSGCADDIKRRGITCAGFPVKADRRSGGWHFINIPLGATPVKGQLGRWCHNHGREDECAPMAIKAQLKVLRDPAASRHDKQLALMFVVHLVGDEHQPLHASDAGDAGGNRVLVRFMQTARQHKPSNLHHVWDNALYADSTVRKRGAEDFAAELERDMRGRDTRSWLSDDLVELAVIESFNIAKFKIYPALETEGHVLGREYQRRMQPLAFEQLEKAGVRLGELLNANLAPAGV
jgi:hypothetical protein